MQLAPKAAVLCELIITQWAVQGHSRSPIMILIVSKVRVRFPIGEY